MERPFNLGPVTNGTLNGFHLSLRLNGPVDVVAIVSPQNRKCIWSVSFGTGPAWAFSVKL